MKNNQAFVYNTFLEEFMHWKFLKWTLILVGIFFTVPINAAAPIEIGVIYNLTGAQAPLDKPSLQGAELAAQIINETGGVLGRPLKLNVVDGQTNLEIIQQAAKQFANNPNISVVIGLSDTNMVLAAAPQIANAKKIFLTSGATSPLLIQQVPDYLFLACFTDTAQATALAKYAYQDLQLQTAYLLADNGMDYTKLLAQDFAQIYLSLGGKILLTDTFPHAKTQIKPQLNRLKNAGAPNVIFLATGPAEALSLIQQIRQTQYQQPILGGDSFDSANLVENKTLSNIYFAAHGFINSANQDSQVQNFINAYQKTYHKMPESSFTGLGYDSIQLIAAAITQAKSTNAEDIRQALLNLKWDGITGDFNYPNKPIPQKTIYILQIQNGKESIAKEITP